MRRGGPQSLYDGDGALRKPVRDRLSRARALAVYLDYDGTLTPIRSNPEEATLSNRAVQILHALLAHPRVTLAIVTGRSLQQIRAFLRTVHPVIIANHGLEISRSGTTWIHPAANAAVPLMRTVRRELIMGLNGIPGVVVENKNVIAAVHYRNVPATMIRRVKTIAHRTAASHAPRVRVSGGKKVLELRPAVRWTKASAIRRLAILQRVARGLPIYVGDDVTDEDAFRSLRRRGITIRVGTKRDTAAEYYVPDVRTVLQFLQDVSKNFRTTISS